MPLANYTDIKATIADYVNKSTLTTQIVDFITLSESKINRRVNLLQGEQLTTATYDTSNTTRIFELPAGFIELRSLEVRKTSETDIDYVGVKYKDPKKIKEVYNSIAGKPKWYTLRDQLEFERLADVSYKLRMHMIKKWDIATDTTNWLLTNHPDIYLYAGLIEGGLFLKNPNQLPTYKTLLDEAIDEVNKKDAKSKNDSELSVTELAAMNSNNSSYNIFTDD